jgi:hypothetical protein
MCDNESLGSGLEEANSWAWRTTRYDCELAIAKHTLSVRPSEPCDIREDGLVSHSYLFMPPSCNGIKSSGGATPEV